MYVLDLLDARCVDRLHGLVDFQKRLTTLEKKGGFKTKSCAFSCSYGCIWTCMFVTSFRLKVGDAMHDDMVKEQGFVVDLDVSREQATEVVHIPERG